MQEALAAGAGGGSRRQRGLGGAHTCALRSDRATCAPVAFSVRPSVRPSAEHRARPAVSSAGGGGGPPGLDPAGGGGFRRRNGPGDLAGDEQGGEEAGALRVPGATWKWSVLHGTWRFGAAFQGGEGGRARVSRVTSEPLF